MCNITPAVSHPTLSHCCGNSELAYSASAYLGGNSDRASSHASRENVQINSWSRDEFSSRQRGLRMPHRIMGSTLGQTKISHRFWYIVIPYLNWARTRIKHFFLHSFVSRSRASANINTWGDCEDEPVKRRDVTLCSSPDLLVSAESDPG